MATTEELNPLKKDREIVLERLIAAPATIVWRAWTEPGHIENWWGPEGFTTTTHSRDVRPGGEWRFTMHGSDGRDYENKIVFDEVEPPKRLSYRHAGEGDTEDVRFRSEATFDAREGGTLVRLRMIFATQGERDRVVAEYGAVEGGRQTLERLAQYAARLAG